MQSNAMLFRARAARAIPTAATALIVALVVASAQQSLAPMWMQTPRDSTTAQVHETDRVFRHAASYALETSVMMEL